MYLETAVKTNCTGCTACKDICQQNAIEMKKDEKGFYYPFINKEKCINCNLCKNVCPLIKHEGHNIKHAYAVKHKIVSERKKSRSGGAFVVLSDYILKQGGTIYGSKLKDNLEVIHSRAESKQTRDEFRGSKYVQSEMGDIISQVIEDLKSERYVLFSGTPCQVAGLINAVKIKRVDTNKLYTCDLVCHGVPSPKIYKDYINYIEEKNSKKVVNINFRDKSYGWKSHYETFYFNDGTKLTTDYFKELFYKHYILRDSCFECHYANRERVSDITIADFWGIDEILPEFYDELGVSLILTNTKKGEELFNINKDKVDYKECDIEKALKENPNTTTPSKPPEDLEKFWKYYYLSGINEIIEKYVK